MRGRAALANCALSQPQPTHRRDRKSKQNPLHARTPADGSAILATSAGSLRRERNLFYKKFVVGIENAKLSSNMRDA